MLGCSVLKGRVFRKVSKYPDKTIVNIWFEMSLELIFDSKSGILQSPSRQPYSQLHNKGISLPFYIKTIGYEAVFWNKNYRNHLVWMLLYIPYIFKNAFLI